MCYPFLCLAVMHHVITLFSRLMNLWIQQRAELYLKLRVNLLFPVAPVNVDVFMQPVPQDLFLQKALTRTDPAAQHNVELISFSFIARFL